VQSCSMEGSGLSWLRLDDRFHRHRKVAPLHDRVWRLHVTGLLECCANGTDGRVDRELPQTWPSVPRGKALANAIDQLVDRGLWEETESGWMIHDFLEWNISADRAEAIKKARSEAGKRGGKRSAKRKQTSKQLLEQTPSTPEANIQANFNPDPDPDPDPDPGDHDHPPTPLRVSKPETDPLTESDKRQLEVDLMAPREFVDRAVADWVAEPASPGTERFAEQWRTTVIKVVRGSWRDPRRRREILASLDPVEDTDGAIEVDETGRATA